METKITSIKNKNNKIKMMEDSTGKLKPYYQVVQDNALIMAEHKMNLKELIAFKMVVSAINTSNDNPEFREVSLKKTDVIKFLFPALKETEAHNITGEYYKRCKNYLRKLLKVEVIIENKKEQIYTVLCSHVKWEKAENLVKISFSGKIAPYILNLQKNFTQYEVGRLKYIKSTYAIRLYEYFNMMVHDVSYTWTVSIAEFRKMLGVQNKYKEVTRLRIKVLDPAVKELQSTFMLNGVETRKTDFNIDYKLIKGGYNSSEVVAIEFSVTDIVKKAAKKN